MVSLAIVALGLLAAGMGAAWQQNENALARQLRFEHFTQDFGNTFVAKFENYRFGLLGACGAFSAAGMAQTTRARFADYANSRDTEREFPGVAGVGFVRRVAAAQEAEFVNSARRDGVPDFAVRQFAPHPGDRYLIQYIEPQDSNYSAIGLDLASEPNRRKAAEHAIESGKATLTAPIIMVGSAGEPMPSFMLLLPVFGKGMPLDTAAPRSSANVGWCYYPLVIRDLLKYLGLGGPEISVQLTDITDASAPAQIYSGPDFNSLDKNPLSSSMRITVFEREWLIETRAKPQFLPGNVLAPQQVAMGIATLFFLLASVVYFAMRNRVRHEISSISQSRLAAIIDSSTDAIIGADLNGQVSSWNKAAEAIFGYREKDALGRSLIDLIVPEELAQEDRDFFTRIGRGELVPHFSTVRHTRLGAKIDVSVSLSPIRDNKGQIIGAAKTLRDITQQKRNEQLFRLAVEAAPSAMLLVNQAQQITLVNQQTEVLFGYERAELLGKPISSLVPLRFRAHHPDLVQGYSAAPNIRTMGEGKTLHGVRKNGSEVLIEIALNPIETPDGMFTLASVVDISKRHQLETQLHSTYARLEMALESSGLGIWVLDLANNSLTWDKRMLEIYGAPEDLADSKLFYDYWKSRVHPDDVALATAKLHGHIAGTDEYKVEFRILQDNGNIRYVQAAGILEHNDKGEAVQMVGTNRDITDIKLAQERVLQANASLEAQVSERTSELQQLNTTLESQVAERSIDLTRAMEIAVHANTAKSEFLANMSHEIRTPLNGILGLAYLMDKHDLSPTVRAMAHKINSSGKSLLGIINDILDFSKIESKHLQIEEVPFRLSDILDNLAGILSAAVGKKNLEVAIASVPVDADYLRGDPLRLGQVLLNLASNAVKFTHQGEVVLAMEKMPATAADRHCLRFVVRDTGVGIPADKLERIFQPFSQADSSTTRTFGGTGLGLTISNQLVQLMGGTLQVQSEPGVGSQFSFILEFAGSEPTRNATPELSHQCVLVVDDNETARMVLQEAGRSLGWSVDVVESGEQALELYRRSPQPSYDALLVDWRMPGLNGLQTLEQLIPSLQGAIVPAVVMVTSYDRDDLMDDPLSRFADVVASKPMTASSMFNAVVEAKSHHGLLTPRLYTQSVGQRLAGIRVMVVDDSEINRDVALDILVGEGALVDIARDGAEALIRLSSGSTNYDIVLMDVQMPVMDGYEATRQIRLHPSLKHLPVIALTAGALKNQHEMALQRGMDAFVPKPFDVDQLLDTIVQLVQDRATGALAPQRSGMLLAGAPPATSVAQGGNHWDDKLLFDVDGAQRKWRRTETLIRHLNTFLQEHGADGTQLLELLAAGSTREMVNVSHKLRGAAGALSLERCMALAATIEVSAQSNNAPEQIAVRIQELQGVLQATVGVVEDYLQSHQPAVDATLKVLTAGIPLVHANKSDQAGARRALLAQMRVAVDTDDPSQVEQHLPSLEQLLPHADLARLQALLDGFDFEGVSKWIQTAEVGLEVQK